MPKMLPVLLGSSLLAAITMQSTMRSWADEENPECRRCLAEAERSFERRANGLCARIPTILQARRQCQDEIEKSRADAQRQCRQSYVCLVKLPQE